MYFIQPLILRPTSCWKIDWDELESNQQNFNALASLLHQQVIVFVITELLVLLVFRVMRLIELLQPLVKGIITYEYTRFSKTSEAITLCHFVQ